MEGGLVADVPVRRGLAEVGVVPGQGAGEDGLGHAGAPHGEEAVALRVRVLQQRALPLVTAWRKKTF